MLENFFSLMHKGGPVMWPLIALSVIALGVLLERIVFNISLLQSRAHESEARILALASEGKVSEGAALARDSSDFVIRVLSAGLNNLGDAFSSAVLLASGRELRSFAKGVVVLDTIVTLAPLLGLLGTITGMIRSFGLLGAQELGSPVTITGGIAEALLATAFGLGLAILALVPLNILNARLEAARAEIESAVNRLEISLKSVSVTN